ncbi:MAG: atpF [Phycisphaerales bacterium]|nr:atpF [Phycisphaerales bacterium]
MQMKILSLLSLFVALAAPVARAAEAESGHEHPLVGFDAPTAIWTLVIFLIFLAILYPTAWKQVLAGLKKREERIRNDIANAEAARLKAEATLKDFNAQLATAGAKSQEIIAKATLDAQAVADRIRVQAQKEAEEAKERATRDIAEARDQALREIYEQAAGLSTSIAEKILRRTLNPDDQRDLVAQSLEQLQKVNRG